MWQILHIHIYLWAIFFEKSYIDSIVYGSNFGAYYYFDDVCVSTDSTLCYQNVGINENDNNKNISMYPNPASNYFTIENTQAYTPYSITIFNCVGQTVYKEEMLHGKKIIDIEKFDDGLFTIEINSENKKSHYKLIKQ